MGRSLLLSGKSMENNDNLQKGVSEDSLHQVLLQQAVAVLVPKPDFTGSPLQVIASEHPNPFI